MPLWVLVRRAAYDTTLRKRRKLQDYGGKLECTATVRST